MKKPTPPKPAPATGHTIVADADPRSIARAEALLASIERRKARITEDFYGLGEELRELRDKKLYQKVYGFTSFDQFLEERAVYSPAQARKLIAITRGMSKKRALSLGVEKAYAAVALANATPEPDSADEIFDEGHKVAGKRPRDASVADFEAAAKGARKKAKKSASSKLVTDVERARAKRRAAGITALRRALKAAGVARLSLEERRDGALIPWAVIEKLGE